MRNACLPCRLRKAYPVLWVANRFVGLETPKHNAFYFKNLNFILNIFQKSHAFLDLTDLLIICIYLRTTERHFCDQGNVRHLLSKLPKCNLVQTLNTFWNPSLRIFAAGKASLVSIERSTKNDLIDFEIVFLDLKSPFTQKKKKKKICTKYLYSDIRKFHLNEFLIQWSLI